MTGVKGLGRLNLNPFGKERNIVYGITAMPKMNSSKPVCGAQCDQIGLFLVTIFPTKLPKYLVTWLGILLGNCLLITFCFDYLFGKFLKDWITFYSNIWPLWIWGLHPPLLKSQQFLSGKKELNLETKIPKRHYPK